ncbi:hypothetical protein ABH930_004801 [Kitasatospora sp. GAS204A]|uniref:hypothetical protein n=1 Tax=unclassified Kitasatospora TaxID=2633591 RepID=UPI0024750467|nr:hypothetical protein [Kitasatospora sp. GAS204B]MDH6120705.1 hypothetical protein [Kitasatospora sp. GAS204B]
MIRTDRLSAVALAGLFAFLVTGCGPTTNPAPANAAQPAPATTAAGTVAKPSDLPGANIGGSGTISLSGGASGSYHFTTVACLGEKSPSGKLTMSAAVGSPGSGTAAIIDFDGTGKFTLTMTVAGATPSIWQGQSAVGAAANRTVDTVKLTDLPITQMTGGTAKASGTLTCSGTQAMS